MSIEKVRAAFAAQGIADRIRELVESSATVALAAQALGCEPGRIAKTLSFQGKEQPILVVAAGDGKIDNHRFKERFGVKAKMLAAEEVPEKIGHAVGGVCPFAVNEGVEVYLDDSLRRFETVFPACGSSNSAIDTISKFTCAICSRLFRACVRSFHLELVFISETWYNSSMKEVRAGRKPYPTDLTDSQWEEIEPLYSGMRNRKWSKRELTNAVLYIVKTGCQWRQLPHDFPPYQTVYSFFSRGAKSGLWEKILAHLVEKTRKDAGKSAEPHYALIDSQSVKTVADNEARGIDGGKKQKGANGMPS